MSHEIEIINGKASMMFAGKTPWHSLGQQLEEGDLYDIEKAIPKSGLDWTAELVRLVTQDDSTPVSRFAVRRTTDKKVLGTVGEGYHILQNIDAFKWFQPFLEAKTAQLNTAGSLRGGSRIWILARICGDPLVIAKDDLIERYILLSHSHDGTLSVRAGFSPIRVVCANTLSLAHKDNASKLIRIKHSKDVLQNLENIRETMNLVNQEFEATAEQYRLLVNKQINQNDLEKYVKKILKVENVKNSDLSTRMKNIIGNITELCECGRGNNLPSVRGTYWTAYNGVNEYLSYVRGNSADNRLNSLWFGDGAIMNKFALETALDMVV
jgi:phage/plasmid-like protein (TIGR03299 family)